MRSHATRNQIGRQARVAPVSLIAFLRMVDWSTMTYTVDRHVRAVGDGYRSCPIVAVWGGLNCSAETTAFEHGMRRRDAADVMAAADGAPSLYDVARDRRVLLIRRAMHALMNRAHDTARVYRAGVLS